MLAASITQVGDYFATNNSATFEADLEKTTVTYRNVGGHEILADVYRPKGNIVRLVIVYIHGGALIRRNRATDDRIPRPTRVLSLPEERVMPLSPSIIVSRRKQRFPLSPAILKQHLLVERRWRQMLSSQYRSDGRRWRFCGRVLNFNDGLSCAPETQGPCCDVQLWRVEMSIGTPSQICIPNTTCRKLPGRKRCRKRMEQSFRMFSVRKMGKREDLHVLSPDWAVASRSEWIQP